MTGGKSIYFLPTKGQGCFALLTSQLWMAVASWGFECPISGWLKSERLSVVPLWSPTDPLITCFTSSNIHSISWAICNLFTDTDLLGKHNTKRETDRMRHLCYIKIPTSDSFNGTACPWVCGSITECKWPWAWLSAWRRTMLLLLWPPACGITSPTCHLGSLPYVYQRGLWNLLYEDLHTLLTLFVQKDIVWFDIPAKEVQKNIHYYIHYIT